MLQKLCNHPPHALLAKTAQTGSKWYRIAQDSRLVRSEPIQPAEDFSKAPLPNAHQLLISKQDFLYTSSILQELLSKKIAVRTQQSIHRGACYGSKTFKAFHPCQAQKTWQGLADLDLTSHSHRRIGQAAVTALNKALHLSNARHSRTIPQAT